jgi:hypothetical protein
MRTGEHATHFYSLCVLSYVVVQQNNINVLRVAEIDARVTERKNSPAFPMFPKWDLNLVAGLYHSESFHPRTTDRRDNFDAVVDGGSPGDGG